jgi:hypothetical protein
VNKSVQTAYTNSTNKLNKKRSKLTMMTITKKQDIAINFRSAVKRIRHNRNIIERIKTNVSKHGILRGEMQKIINGEIEFEKLDNDMICVIIHEMYQSIGSDSLDPRLYFSAKEINNSLKKDFSKEEESLYPINLQHVDKDNDTFKTYVPISFLAKLYNNNILQYNNVTSSNHKLVYRGDRVMKVVNFDTEKVIELATELMNGRREPSRVILNVLKGSGNIFYNEQYSQLIIKESQIDIVDGLHELAALSLVCEQKPNNKLNAELLITNYNSTDLKQFIKQLKIRTGGVN